MFSRCFLFIQHHSIQIYSIFIFLFWQYYILYFYFYSAVITDFCILSICQNFTKCLLGLYLIYRQYKQQFYIYIGIHLAIMVISVLLFHFIGKLLIFLHLAYHTSATLTHWRARKVARWSTWSCKSPSFSNEKMPRQV